MRVLAVDPGVTTGLASYELTRTGIETFESWFETSTNGVLRLVRDMLVEDPDLEVVIEDFTISAGTFKKSVGGSKQTLEMIGALKWIVSDRGFSAAVMQQPAEALMFAGDKWVKLKRIGWYKPGPDHPNSAAAHLLLYLVRRNIIEVRRIV